MDSGAIIACVATPANRPEHEAVPLLKTDFERQELHVAETHIHRGYIASPAITELEEEGSLILCKPWKTPNGDLYTKEDFNINLKSKTVTCPSGHTEKFEYGKTVQFNPVACDKCAARTNCTNTLAHVGQRQGRRARYLGTRKNTFDLRRAAAIQNLEITQRNAA